jgi:hypothetical protein
MSELTTKVQQKLDSFLSALSRLGSTASSADQKLSVKLAEFSDWLDSVKLADRFQGDAQATTGKPKQDVNNYRCAGRVLRVLAAADALVDPAVSIHALIPLHRLLVPGNWTQKTKPSTEKMADAVVKCWTAAVDAEGRATKDEVEAAIGKTIKSLKPKASGRNGRPTTPAETPDADETLEDESPLDDVRISAARIRMTRDLGTLTSAYGDDSLPSMVRCMTLAVQACADYSAEAMLVAIGIYHEESTKTEDEPTTEETPEEAPKPKRRTRKKVAA